MWLSFPFFTHTHARTDGRTDTTRRNNRLDCSPATMLRDGQCSYRLYMGIFLYEGTTCVNQFTGGLQENDRNKVH